MKAVSLMWNTRDEMHVYHGVASKIIQISTSVHCLQDNFTKAQAPLKLIIAACVVLYCTHSWLHVLSAKMLPFSRESTYTFFFCGT